MIEGAVESYDSSTSVPPIMPPVETADVSKRVDRPDIVSEDAAAFAVCRCDGRFNTGPRFATNILQ
jgi:hypothetical protein